MTTTNEVHAVLLSDDLMFTSRITGTARDLGFTIRALRSVAALEQLASEQRPRCILVDLGYPGLNVQQLLENLRTKGTAPRVVAYGSHVDTATLQAARAAGCAVVLPRSKFVEDLPRALPEWLA
jgi:CheY-like chemotaxis protein